MKSLLGVGLITMPSKDTVQFRITTGTANEIERIRKVIAKEMGVDISMVTKKKAEIVMRLKSQKGHVTIVEINNVFIGKIR